MQANEFGALRWFLVNLGGARKVRKEKTANFQKVGNGVGGGGENVKNGGNLPRFRTHRKPFIPKHKYQ